MACARRTDAIAPRARRWAALLAAGLALGALGGCAEPPAPFSATFVFPHGASVVLDYWGERDFRFASPRGGAQTWVLDGQIHIVVAPSLGFAGRGQVFLVGELLSRPDPAATIADEGWTWGPPPAGQPDPMPGVTVRTARAATPTSPASPVEIVVAEERRLAAAQFVVDRTLRPAMDMTLCGDAVNALVASWPAAFTGSGWAAIGAMAGPRIDGSLRPAPPRPELPDDYDFQDLRIATR